MSLQATATPLRRQNATAPQCAEDCFANVDTIEVSYLSILTMEVKLHANTQVVRLFLR